MVLAPVDFSANPQRLVIRFGRINDGAYPALPRSGVDDHVGGAGKRALQVE